jgi:hypothetical protein
MNRRQFLLGLAAGTTAAFSKINPAFVTQLPSGAVKLETETAFLLSMANPLWEQRIEEATFVHRLNENQWLVWGEDPTTLGELERIMTKSHKWEDYQNASRV